MSYQQSIAVYVTELLDVSVTNVYVSNISALNGTSNAGLAKGIEIGDGNSDTINATFAFGTVSGLRI